MVNGLNTGLWLADEGTMNTLFWTLPQNTGHHPLLTSYHCSINKRIMFPSRPDIILWKSPVQGKHTDWYNSLHKITNHFIWILLESSKNLISRSSMLSPLSPCCDRSLWVSSVSYFQGQPIRHQMTACDQWEASTVGHCPIRADNQMTSEAEPQVSAAASVMSPGTRSWLLGVTRQHFLSWKLKLTQFVCGVASPPCLKINFMLKISSLRQSL